MKKVLFLIALINLGITKAQIINIPDSNFKDYLINNNSININGDDEIQVSEATNFTGTIFAVDLDISDFTGIEEFINLYRLRFGNDPISNIDLSNNTLLESVEFFNTLITEIDFSNQHIMEWAIVSGNPNLTYINYKNGNNENFLTGESYFHNLPNLETVCIDDETSNFGIEINGTGRSVNFTENCTLTIVENEFSDFSIYPTPTENILNIKSKTEIVKIKIYSQLGQKIKETTQNQIDISNLTQGLYFVKVEDVNGNMGVKKIVKK